jgi:hypothetical protein
VARFRENHRGPVFRPIDKWGDIGAAALDPQSVNARIKSRCAAAGLDPAEFSAHGSRSGYLTEAARAGVPAPEAMAAVTASFGATGCALLQ